MTPNLKRFQKIVFFAALFTLIPLWNIPHTIAGRYTCEGILLLSVLLYKPEWRIFFQKSKLLVAFFIYLIVQLVFFSENFRLAFSNFRAEWMHFILFSIIGAGTGLLVGNEDSKKFLFYFGTAFSVPLLIHIALFCIKAISIGKMPWGYWGINEIHGDFAYPALEAAILFSTYYLLQAKTKYERLLIVGFIAICIASPLLATSRGGVGFTFAGILFVVLSHFFLGSGKSISTNKKILVLLSVPILLLGIYKIGVISDPNRWSGIISRVSVGLGGDPSLVYCKGIGTLEESLKAKGIEITPAVQKGLDSVVDGDGARMMAARSGLVLTLENPMGINQSKQAYQQAITSYCGGIPKIFIAHAHNAWIDTALAIGIPGAILLLLVLINYAKIGYLALLKHPATAPYGMALFASAWMWILRGLLDSTMRDQMLEMQAFIFAALMGIILAKNNLTNKAK
jgi:hypothetical protein